MRVLRTASEFSIRAPAKLNLFLEILGKRGDGFHEIETLMCPISLSDSIGFRDEPNSALTLDCVVSARPSERSTFVPAHPDRKRQSCDPRPRTIAPRNGSSLGCPHYAGQTHSAGRWAGRRFERRGGCALVANAGWNLGLPHATLHRLAAELGSDIPFFLHGGAAICRGRGEQISPTEPLGTLHAVVVRPPVGLSTAEVYRACRPASGPASALPLASALARGNWRGLGRMFVNRLQDAAAGLCPWIDRLRHEFARLDFIAHQMSGSGTSYFGLCRNACHARQSAARLVPAA